MANSVQFQGSAESKGFQPIGQTTYIPRLKENQARLENSLAVNNQLENQYAQARQTVDAGNIASLAKFSQTLTETLTAEAKKRNEAEMQQGLADAYNEGVPVAEQQAYEADKAQLQTADNQIERVALAFAKDGAPFEVTNQVKSLSGWRAYGYAMGKARVAGEAYPFWIQDKLTNDTTTKIQMPDGTVVSPAEAAGNPLYQAAVTEHLRRQFFQEYGLVGMNPALLNEHTFPGMRRIEGQLLAKARLEHNIGQSQELLQEHNDALADGQMDMSTYIMKTSTLLDENGRPLGNAGAWKSFESLVDEAANAGTPLDLEALGAQIDPQTGKTFKERWKRRWALLEERQANRIRENWSDHQADQEMGFQQAEEEAFARITGDTNPWSDGEIRAIQKELEQRYGRRSSKLDTLIQGHTIEAEQKEQIEAQLKFKAEHGMLTPDDLIGLPLDLQQKYGQFAKSQGDGGAIASSYLKSIEGAVKARIPNWTEDKGLGGRAQLAVAELQVLWRQKYATYLNAGASPTDAAQQATTEVLDYFDKSQDPNLYPNSKFFVGADLGTNGAKPGAPPPDENMFPNLLPKSRAEGFKHQIARFDQLAKQAAAEGDVRKVFDVPGAVLNKQAILAIGDGKSGNIQVPAIVQYYAQKFNTSPFEIINRQRKAAGFPELDKTPAIEAAEKLSPRAQALINQFPTANRSVRAWGSTGAFNEAIVPMGLGKEISKAAKANGIDPAWVAAVIDWENRGNWKNKTSPAGAQGIAQFMPDTARELGVNPQDPVSSVQGAAKYLKYLLDYFQGDMRLATIAYNAGMGNVKKYGGPIPGDRESGEYYQGVMKSYYKYSGGNRQALTEVTRTRFREVVGASGYRGTNDVVATGQRDQGNRPISFAPNAAKAWKQMLAAGMPFDPANVASTHRTEQDYIRIKGQGNRPASNSKHNYGMAIDAHGATGQWIRQNGSRYGWFPFDYEGTHGGHYEFRG